MRTLRAALASTTPPRSTPRLYGLTVTTVRLPETCVRRQPKPLYVFNRFGCTASAVLRVRLPPKQPSVFARITHYGARPGRLDRNQPGRINGLEIALAASAAAVTQTDDVDHCPRCRHRWAMHTPDHGCSFPASTPAGVHFCGCEERPAQGSDWEVRLTQNTDH
jgi:hypothetical protein